MIFRHEEWRQMRKERGITQVEVCEKSGVNISTIKNVEAGRRKIKLPDLYAMAKVLEVDPMDYLRRKSIVLTCLNNKGGASKTTTAANLAYSMATEYDQKVLLIDTDMQQNLGMHYNIVSDDTQNFYNSFVQNESIYNHIRSTEYNNIDFVTSHDGVSALETEIVSMDLKEFRMQNILKEIIDEGIYDYIIMDCNPSLNATNKSILFATDELLIPLEPSAFGIKGLQYLVDFYYNVKQYKHNLNITGILFNKCDRRKNITEEAIRVVREGFKDEAHIFKTKIPVDTSIEQAQLYCTPVGVHFERSRANKAFNQLAKEVMRIAENR